MDSDHEREIEILSNLACGLDPLTAIAAIGDKKTPCKPQRLGCLAAVLLAVALVIAYAVRQ